MCISDDKQISQAQSIITYSPFMFELFAEKSNDMVACQQYISRITMFRHYQVLQNEMRIKTARNLNKSEGECISYLHGARKSRYPNVSSRCRISSLAALFQRLREKRESFFQFIWKRELKGEYKGRSCIVLHPCFPGHGQCKCWLLFV